MTENPVNPVNPVNPINTANPVDEAVALLSGLTESQLEEVGRALSSNVTARLSSKSFSTGGWMRKLTSLLVLLILAAVIASIFAYFNATKTIASGERKTRQADWGYSLDQYHFRNRMRLDLWSDSSLFSSSSDATLDLSNVSVNRITEERWLADSRAIYLHMLLAADDKEQSAKVIYDFQRGELYTTSPANLWRVPNESDKNLKMTEEEFQAVLNRYGGQAPAATAPAPSVSVAPSLTPSASPSVAASPSASVSPSPDKVDELQR